MKERIRAFLRGLRYTPAIYPPVIYVYDGWSGLASEVGDMGALREDFARIGMDLRSSMSRADQIDGEADLEQASQAHPEAPR